MRRYVAGALLLILVGQSSGAALADTPSHTKGVDLASLFRPVASAIVSSQLYAIVTGSGDRYAAMHAPPPQMQLPPTRIHAAALMREQHALRPRIREGVQEIVVMPPRSALDPKHRRVDPLALRASTTKRALAPQSTAVNTGAVVLEPLRLLAQPPPVRGAQSTTTKRGQGINPTILSSAGAGIEHWWTYEERAIPGIGKAMLNVGTGNLIVSAMDVDVPEQGIDLAFQRVYNSQSLHDYNGDDGGDPAIFGNRWTNNFDASIVYNASANTITVYDLDGTACTYTANANAPGGWQPCTGEYATLVPTDPTDCTYAWTKPTGTVYWFHSDGGGNGVGCGIPQAKRGHLQEILARNQLNDITFAYSYDNSGSKTSENITKIVVNHSDGDSLTLKFGLIVGTSINELAEIIRPDGDELQYSYDTSGNLLEVDKPGNNSANAVPSNPNSQITVPQGDVPETYAYATGTSTLEEACGPRCTVAMWNSPNSPTDGSALLFTVDSSLRLTSWQVQGVLNFTPTDGTSTVLQSGAATGWQTWYTGSFQYGTTGSCGTSQSSTTYMCDSDGHGTVWTTNATGSVTATQDWTGAAEGLWIPTSQSWDGSNNLTSTTDANGYVTQYGYDNNTSLGYDCCGNMVEMQLPQSNDITNGPLAPLSTYSYDANFNVIAYCDPVYNQTNGKSWVSSNPGDGLCPTGANSGAAYFKYSTVSGQDPNEPFGCLTDIYKPSGYHTTVTFATSGGTCGVGLPIKTKGDQVTQFDNSTRTPIQDLGYDGKGNLTSYDRGTNGQNTLDSWTLGYNQDNLNNWRNQNDPNLTSITSYTCHYPDGSILYTETPSQHGIDGNQSSPNAQSLLSGSYSIPPKANVYYYDFDGNQVKVVTHKGCSSNTSCSPTPKTVCTNENTNPLGTTCNYYDGLDRLVETAEPYDTRSFSGGQAYEFYTFRWMNRYIYDLSQAGGSAALTISDSTGTTNSFAAYGSLYKTKEFLPQISGMVASLNNGPYSSGGWSDVRGTSFDGLDRPLKKFELAFGTAPVTKNTYDASGQYDLLSQTTNAVGQITTYAYDHIDRLNQVTFSGTSPLADGRSYTYDADSRTATATNSQLGTLSYVYDVDGDMTSVTEPAQAGAQSLICYAYYPDGMRAYLGIGEPSLDSCGTNTNGITAQNPSNGGIRQPQIFSYAYTEDGLLGTQLVNWGSNHETFSWTYTPSQRETSETDPLYQQVAYQPPNGSTQIRFGEKTYQYDQYGRVSQLVFPAGYTESNPVYDYDDELAGYAQGVPQPTITRYLTLNARGELLGDFPQQNPPPGSTWAQGPTYSANGAQLGNGSFCTGTAPVQAPPNALQIDVRSNMVMAIVNPQCAQGNQNNWVYTYDGAGRQVAVQGISTTDYDAENHVSDTTASPPGSALWGPDTHQRVDTYGGAASTAHWDGDTILFSSLSSGSPILYIGKLATMDYTGDITVIDRDQSGAKVTAHGYQSGNLGLPPWITNGNWYDGWSTGTVRTLYVYKAQKTYPVQLFPGNCNVTDTQNNNYYTCPSNSDGAFAMKRADGYAMIGGLVQGARTYDPTSGQWLTPDPYAGDVRDPISQKPFMWNGNNPVEWNDPSGYCTDPPPGQPRNGCLGGIDWPLNMRFGNTLQGVLDFVVIPQARIEEIGFSLAERFGSGPTRMAFANLESGGLRGLQNGIKTLERRIAEHQEKISEAVERGGADSGNYISSMQTEMKAFENNLGALKALASDIENAVNEAAQVGGSLLRDSEKMY